MQSIRWRFTFVSLLTLLSLYGISSTVFYFWLPKDVRNDQTVFQSRLPSWLPQSHIKLGLDLLGGVQLVLGVDTSSAVESKLGSLSVDVLRWAKDKSLPVTNSYVPKESQKLIITLNDENSLDSFKDAFNKEYPLLELTEKDGANLTFMYKASEMERITKSAVEQAEKVIRTRVDSWGVSEANISRRAGGAVLVQLPGFKDPAQARNLLGRTALLKFKMVDDDFKGFNGIDTSKLPEGITAVNNGGQIAFQGQDRDQLATFLKAYVPQDHELLFERKAIGDGSQTTYRYTSYVLFARTEMNGSDISDARVGQGKAFDNRPDVAITFTGPGARTFAELTGANVNKRLAISLDDVIESVASIREKISGGNASISLGSYSYSETLEQAQKLSMVLKSGAVPATIKVLEERQVGASLGPELADQGIKGILVGLALVLLFMLVFYRRPGAIACVALVLNGIFLLAIMSAFGFALTLPGIAGFVLTLGMAVDANVLINERIRQEIREGRHPRKAMEIGFDKVFWTIIDSHVTTLTAGVVLLETSATGPVKGFAIPLIIGLLVSLFTSLTCTRLFFDMAMSIVPDQKLRGWLAGESALKRATVGNFDFITSGRMVTLAAIILSVVTLGTGFVRGLNLGVDFAGGSEAIVKFEKEVDLAKLHEVMAKSNIKDGTIQSIGSTSDGFQYLVRYDEPHASTGESSAAANSKMATAFKDNLASDLSEFKPEIIQTNYIGPQVGEELRIQGLLSVLFAIIGVIIYIYFRFDLRFMPGALIKMFLDVFIMSGVFVFFWASFDLVSVAAFLTVVGYSVNDTIVIYDRIRENLINHPRRSLTENINISINETLGRSINTSMTVVLSLVGILIFASGQIWTFAMATTVGVVVATVSSIFIATSLVLSFEAWRKNREGAVSLQKAKATT